MAEGPISCLYRIALQDELLLLVCYAPNRWLFLLRLSTACLFTAGAP